MNKYILELREGIPALVKETEIACNGNLTSPDKIVEMINNILHLERMAEEYVYVIGFNSQMRPIAIFEVSHGVVNACWMSQREIMIRLLLCGAVGFVTVHNHPGGTALPSSLDENAWEKIRKAGELIGIKNQDNLIVFNGGYYSDKENRR